MSAIEKIDEKSFIIKFCDEVSKESPVLTAIGCLWTLKSSTTGYGTDKKLTLTLKCEKNARELWKIGANVTFTLIKVDGTKGVTGMKDTHFDVDDSTITMDILLGYDEISKEYIKDGKIRVECLVEIKSTAGIHYKMHNFDKMDENINNTALIVERRKLYVSKQILAMASPVFHKLFYVDSKDTTPDEYLIDNVKYNEFEPFLQLIYGGTEKITEENYEPFLKLAHRFKVAIIKKQCENLLLKSSFNKKKEMLILAEKYCLPSLQSAVFDKLTTYEIKEFSKNSSEFGAGTLRELFLRLSS